jgi:serine/threonine protein kinase
MIALIPPATLINNRYLINKFLGEGGSGRTYLASDNYRFGESCVLKEFVPKTAQEEKLYKIKMLFEREAKVLHQIQHPQIPKFLAWFNDNKRTFIVQEYIDGKTYSQILSERLAENGQPFSEIEVRTWLIEILPVLEYLHKRKIVHRDISLDNVMLRHNQSKPILIDFGVVQENSTEVLPVDSLNSYNSICDSIVGKIGYSPPEQLRLGYSYPSSDIYALAVCAVVLLTGKIPYFLIDEYLDLQWRSLVEISDGFANILEKMLHKVPAMRYHSASEIILELNNLHLAKVQSHHQNLSKLQPLEIINIFKKIKHQKELNQDLEDLLILKELEEEIIQSDETNNSSNQPIYLNLNIANYQQIKMSEPVKPSNNFFSKLKFTHMQTAKKKCFCAVSSSNSNQENTKNPIITHPSYFLKNQIVTINSKFLIFLRHELTDLIGPMSSIIIDDVLEKLPDCTLKEFVDAVVAEIPDNITAQKLQENLYKNID